MTDLDAFPFQPPVDDDWPPTPVLEREPRKCRRHDWEWRKTEDLGSSAILEIACRRCGRLKDVAKSRLGKNSRNRGNAFEREVAAKLGGRRVGQFGDSVDVDVPGWLRVQCKNGTGYPLLIDRWLRAIPVQADLLRAVVLGDAPGSAGKRRTLIAFDLDEFVSWYGPAVRARRT